METFSRGTLDPWYVTGLSDGDAAFTYSRSGKQLALYYSLKMTAAERPMLERIQRFFGAGKLYDVVARAPRANSGFTKEALLYRATRRSELAVILAHFDRYPLQSSKALQYRIWREMVLLKQSFRAVDREKLESLAARLSAACMRRRSWFPSSRG